MFNPDTAPVSALMPSLQTTARSLNVELITAPVHSDAEIETAPHAFLTIASPDTIKLS